MKPTEDTSSRCATPEVAASRSRLAPKAKLQKAQKMNPARNTTQKIRDVQTTIAASTCRAYLTGIFYDTGKRQHILFVTEKHITKYREIVRQIKSELELNDLTKVQACALRDDLVQKSKAS